LLGKALIRDGIFLLIAKWFQKTVIVFNRGWNLDFEQILRRRWLWLFRWVYFRADAFIVLGSEFREKLIKMGYSKPIYLETTTVDDTYFLDITAPVSDRHHISDPFNILFLTRVERYKGIYEALNAYQKLKEDFAQARFIIAGDGSELAGVRDYVERHGLKDVEFTGFLQGCCKKKVFDRSHCYLFPSYSEGMPTSVLEAMACGLPIVTRPVGGIKDFFEDEKMGYIVNSFEPSFFTDALVRLIEEPETCVKMGKYNREYAAKRFTASHVAKRLERIYEKVLAVKDDNM
jgi:glycosyltransferase involved in cell wall biosynthesis